MGALLKKLRSLFSLHLDAFTTDVDPLISQSIKRTFLESSAGGVMGVFTGGIVLTGFAIALGASEFVFGLLAAIPAAANLFQIQASRILERTGERRNLVVRFAAAHRIMWILIALTALIPFGDSQGYRIWIFLILFSIASLLGLFSAVPFISWLIDLVPQRVRGRYFAMRTFMGGTVGILLGIGAGKFIDFWKATGISPEIAGFSILMIAGAGSGLWSVSLLSKLHHPPFVRPKKQEPFLHSLREPFRNSDYRKLFLFRIMTDLAGGVAAPFIGLYMLTSAHLGFTFVATLATISTLANLLTLPTWGRLCDRYGYKPVIAICIGGKVLFTALWLFTSSETIWLFVVIHLLSTFDAGLGLAIPNLIYKTVPQERRPLYIAVDGSVVGIAATTAPLIGGVLAGLFQHLEVTIGAFHLEHLKFIFLLSTLLRIATLPFLRRVKEPEAARPVDVIRVLLPFRDIDIFEGFQQMVELLLTPARYIRDRVGPGSEDDRGD